MNLAMLSEVDHKSLAEIFLARHPRQVSGSVTGRNSDFGYGFGYRMKSMFCELDHKCLAEIILPPQPLSSDLQHNTPVKANLWDWLEAFSSESLSNSETFGPTLRLDLI